MKKIANMTGEQIIEMKENELLDYYWSNGGNDGRGEAFYKELSSFYEEEIMIQLKKEINFIINLFEIDIKVPDLHIDENDEILEAIENEENITIRISDHFSKNNESLIDFTIDKKVISIGNKNYYL